jgi:alcohol dehydrogenase YqhD (iron-dependent ADH family)
MPINLKELGLEVTEEQIEIMADKCTAGNSIRWGDIKKVDKKDVIELYRMAR